MSDQRCKKCGRLIFSASATICRYCENKEKIENGDFKKGKGKKHTNWKNFH